MQNPDRNVEKKGTIYVAIDIEKSGPRMIDPIIAIGVAVGQGEKLLHKKLWCLPVPLEIQFESNCLKFWRKPENYKILENIRSHANRFTDLQTGIASFYGFISSLEEFYPDYDIQFISDNPAYDIGHIDFLLEEWFRINPIRYDRFLNYRVINDPSGLLHALGIKNDMNDLIKEKYNVIHDHMPDNDSHVMLMQQILLEKMTKKLKGDVRNSVLAELKNTNKKE
jgi:hypothetical protein